MDVSITLNDDIGNTKLHHTFNGAAPVGRGYMICNGDIINSTNYDAIHGSGAYTRDNVASSPLIGKYLPNMVDKFAVGAAATAQTGGSAITSVGLTGHTLITATHSHKWLNTVASAAASDQSYDSAGTATNFSNTGYLKNAGTWSVALNNAGGTRSPNIEYTDKAGSLSQSIKPESIEMLYIIKVI